MKFIINANGVRCVYSDVLATTPGCTVVEETPRGETVPDEKQEARPRKGARKGKQVPRVRDADGQVPLLNDDLNSDLFEGV